MDVVGLKDAAQVGPVRCTRAQPPDRRILVPEGLKKGERKLLSIEGLLSQRGNRFFNLNGVQLLALLFCGWRRFLALRAAATVTDSEGSASRLRSEMIQLPKSQRDDTSSFLLSETGLFRRKNYGRSGAAAGPRKNLLFSANLHLEKPDFDSQGTAWAAAGGLPNGRRRAWRAAAARCGAIKIVVHGRRRCGQRVTDFSAAPASWLTARARWVETQRVWSATHRGQDAVDRTADVGVARREPSVAASRALGVS